jgi:hypothetical protein
MARTVDLAEEVVVGDERIQVDARFGRRVKRMHSLQLPPGIQRGTQDNENRTTAKNQPDRELAKVPFFNRPGGFSTCLTS